MNYICDSARDASTTSHSINGYILVGMFSSLASDFLSNLFQAYAAYHTGVHIDFIDGSTLDHVSSMRRDMTDVAFIAGDKQYSGCETVHLWSEQLFAVLPSTHRLANKPILSWLDLSSETFILSEQVPGGESHDFLAKRLADLGQHPEVQRQNVGRDNLMWLVMMGRGLTIASEAITSTSFLGVVYRPIIGEMLQFSAVWASKNENPALHDLLDMARARREAIKPVGLSMTPPYPPSNVELS